MDRIMYMKNAGITAGRRALFSYMTEPRGSYYLPMIFSNLLKKKKFTISKEDLPKWNHFLADYIVFRFYVARHVLKDFAKEYTALLQVFTGIRHIEEHFAELLSPPEGLDEPRKLLFSLTDEVKNEYTEEKFKETYEYFDEIAAKAEAKWDEKPKILKMLISEVLSYLCNKNKIPLYTPVFWFFHQETVLYADYLSSFYGGLIPEEIKELQNMTYDEEEEEDDFYTGYKLPALISLFIASILLVIMLKAN